MPKETDRQRNKVPGSEPKPEPVEVRDDQRPAVEGATQARAGQILRGGLMRRVLVISLALIIAAFALIYLIFFFGQADEEAAAPTETPAEEEVAPPE